MRPKERRPLHTHGFLGSIRRRTFCKTWYYYFLPGQVLNVLQFSQESSTFHYQIAGDHARNKVFVLPIPDTPDESTMHPSLPPNYFTPQSLNQSLRHDGAVSALQILSNDRFIFSRSSLQGPNDVFVIMASTSLKRTLLRPRRLQVGRHV
jgi:hypothetical protein